VKKLTWALLLYAALATLYLLHNDLWLWNDPSLVLGLPVGLVYHVVFCLATSAVLALLVTYAWPDDLEVADSEMRREGMRREDMRREDEP
jgi:uncharacterized oligopeptide transporter (OPT) family protein